MYSEAPAVPLLNTKKFTFTKIAIVSFDYSKYVCKCNLVERLVRLMKVFIDLMQFHSNLWKQDKV